MADLSAVPLEELQREFVETAHAFAALSDRRAELNAEIERRAKQATARARLNSMSDSEREALKKVLAEDGATQAPGQ